MKADYKAAKTVGEKPTLGRQATLPTIPDVGLRSSSGGDELPEMPSLQRAETFSTLPPYASRPGTPGSIELNSMDQKRPLPNRAGTATSNPYSTRAGLVSSASEMGTSNPLSPAPTVSSTDFNGYGPRRPYSPSAHGSYSRPNPTGTMSSNASLRHQPSNSSSSFGARYTETPSNYGEMPYPAPVPVRSPTARPGDSYGRPPMPQQGGGYPPRSATNRSNGESFSPVDGRRPSPAPSVYSNRSGPTMPRNPTTHQSPLNGGGFQAFQPARSATGPMPHRPQQQQPTRNMTTGDYYGRQPPSQGQGQGYDYEYDQDMESQRGGRY